MKKILIVEDQMLARKYLCSCIEKSTECEVASALTRADAALQKFLKQLRSQLLNLKKYLMMHIETICS